MMKTGSRRWMYLTAILTIVFCVHAEQESSDWDQIQNDSEAFSHVGMARMTRGRNGGISENLEEERSLAREERKRIKAERRRLKEERRQERWARRRQKQGQVADEGEDNFEGDDDQDLMIHRSNHHQIMTNGVSVPPSSPLGVPGSPRRLPVPPQAVHIGDSSLMPSANSGSIGAFNNVVEVDPIPAVVNLEWMRANLSSLWSVVRSLSRQQGRPFIQRSRGRHHHSGVIDPPNPGSCPGGEDACRSDGGEICGGEGTCSCGHCFCQAGYYGTFCQCNDHSCPAYDGMTCGGPSRGQCRCGGCVCRPGYAGESCDCPTDTHTCTSPETDEICSGKGTCQCGRCRCNDGHKGMYCEDTVYAAGVCEKLKSCVMCRAWNRELPSCAQCQITVTEVDSLEPSMTTCVLVNSGCLLQFSYIPQTADAYTVLVPRDMACPT